MKSSLDSLIRDGIEVGEGIACTSSPFSNFIVIEFYDGAVEGFASVIGARAIVYFKKAWWDDRQDNRLFRCIVLSEAELRQNSPNLLVFFNRRSKITDWSKPLTDDELGEAAALAEFASQSTSALRLYIFCQDVTGPVFILPAADD
jgi:hypothetical protein